MRNQILLGFLLLWCGRALGHENTPEDRLLFHFATGTRPAADGRTWRDLTGHLKAIAQGSPILTNQGPAELWLQNGFQDWFLAAPDLEAAKASLPQRDFTLSAWVLLNGTRNNGGIVNFAQDNGSSEQGWILGYNASTFTFSLSTQGADDGDGLLTMIRGKTVIEKGRWYHVAASYDGQLMKLYVDGKLEGESDRQSGNILYPKQGRLAIGAYVDENELYPMRGGLHEVKAYARVLGEEEIKRTVAKNTNLLAWRSPVNTELRFVVKPYLQYGTTNSMTLMAETTGQATMWVEYGERQPLNTRTSASSPSGQFHTATLRDLKERTQYFYRMVCLDSRTNYAIGEIGTFQTFPGPNDAWSFGIIGDTQRNPNITRQCAEGIFALRPNVVVHCGDVVDDGFAKQQWVGDLFEPSALLFAHVPVHPVIGNHERNSHWYYDYFHLPDPEYWYSFKLGNAEFFMIDSNKDCSAGSEQYRWLETRLAASTAVWKFAAHHHPCFSSDENDYGDRWTGDPTEKWVDGDVNARALVPLYEKYGVDIALAGHIHSYERTWPLLGMSINQKKGVRYIVSGGGGGGLEQAGPQRAWYTLHVARGHHYCHVVAHDRTIQFKAYDVEGRLFDTFEFTKASDR